MVDKFESNAGLRKTTARVIQTDFFLLPDSWLPGVVRPGSISVLKYKTELFHYYLCRRLEAE